MKTIQTFEEFLNENLNEANTHKLGKYDFEKKFMAAGVNIDVQDWEKDGGFFTTYDNISKDELSKISSKLYSKIKFNVGNPIKSQETGYYLMVNFEF